MNKKKDDTSRRKNESGEEVATDLGEGTESEASEEDYERDQKARGEGPDNLRQRSEWFQKRTGRR